MGHPLALRAQGRAGRVVLFTRNTLCAVALPELALSAATFVDRLLDPAVRLATSTPGADPSGDYTWAMFRLIDAARPGAFATLDAKAQRLVGGSTAPLPADAPDPIAAAFRDRAIDVSLGYCTSAGRLRRWAPGLTVLEVPAAYRAGPEYGLAVLAGADPRATDLALQILSPGGQATLARYGFLPVALPTPPRS
jgi:hypothetical protein